MKLQPAQDIANEIIHALRPDCVHIQVAGSIRRQKPEVKDIEIVYISHTSILQKDFFRPRPAVRLTHYAVRQTHFHANDAIDSLIAQEILHKDTAVKRWGFKYKRAIHCASGVVIELFRAVPHNWGYILALRTGPADFNKLLVTKSNQGGVLPPHIQLRDGYVWYQGNLLRTPTERDFFTALNLPLLHPVDRTAERLRRCIQNRRNQ